MVIDIYSRILYLYSKKWMLWTLLKITLLRHSICFLESIKKDMPSIRLSPVRLLHVEILLNKIFRNKYYHYNEGPIYTCNWDRLYRSWHFLRLQMYLKCWICQAWYSPRLKLFSLSTYMCMWCLGEFHFFRCTYAASSESIHTIAWC